MNVAIVGCGLIGKKRRAALPDGVRLVATADPVLARAHALAETSPGAVAYQDPQAAIRHEGVDAVIVATTNDALASVSLAAIAHGRHVLVEKPAARTVEELDHVRAAAETHKVVVGVGFNHRFHKAFRKAKEIVAAGELGPLMFVRARYGHGGRVGYDREWRADPKLAGGGELLDQGVHLIDLARLFLGDFTKVWGTVHTFFWDMPVEDNGFVHLQTSAGTVAWLHASCSEWKNLFSFELYGRNGKLHVEGLGGSYGVERLSHYKMLPQMGPPDTVIWEYPGEDDSWRAEFAAFLDSVRRGKAEVIGGLDDARAALSAVETVYANKTTP